MINAVTFTISLYSWYWWILVGWFVFGLLIEIPVAYVLARRISPKPKSVLRWWWKNVCDDPLFWPVEIPCPRPEGWPGPWPSTVIVAACGTASREYGMHLIPDSMGMADCKRCQKVLEKTVSP